MNDRMMEAAGTGREHVTQISVMCDEGNIPVISYDDLVDLARMCRNQANVASSEAVAIELRVMASEYLRRAADLKSPAPPITIAE